MFIHQIIFLQAHLQNLKLVCQKYTLVKEASKKSAVPCKAKNVSKIWTSRE